MTFSSGYSVLFARGISGEMQTGKEAPKNFTREKRAGFDFVQTRGFRTIKKREVPKTLAGVGGWWGGGT